MWSGGGPESDNCGYLQRPTPASLDAAPGRCGEGMCSAPPRPRRPARKERDGHMIKLIACSICLRVQRGSDWLEAERVIRDIKSYDDDLPRLRGAVCNDCAELIVRRRVDAADALAA